MFVGTKILPVSSDNQSLLFNFKISAGVSTGNFRQQIEYSGNTSGNSTYNSWASSTSLQTYYLMNYEGQDTQVNGEMNFVMYVHNPFLNAVRGGTKISIIEWFTTLGKTHPIIIPLVSIKLRLSWGLATNRTSYWIVL